MLGGNSADSSGLYLSEEISAHEPSAEERTTGDRVMAWVDERFGRLAYARVDLLAGAVLELELTEPSLFLGQAPGATERLARLIAAWTA